MITGYSFQFDTAAHGVLLHVRSLLSSAFVLPGWQNYLQASIDVANPKEYFYVGRTAIVTSTGSIQLWQQDQIQWTREESLADIRAVEFVDLPEKLIAASNSVDKRENFFAKLGRHQGDLRVSTTVLPHPPEFDKSMICQNLPPYLIRFFKRFVSASYESASSSSSLKDDLWRDAFGFKKLIIVATSSGKVFAMDTAKGNIVWSKILSISNTSGAPLFGEMKLLVSKTGADQAQTPEVVLVAQSSGISVRKMTTLLKSTDTYNPADWDSNSCLSIWCSHRENHWERPNQRNCFTAVYLPRSLQWCIRHFWSKQGHRHCGS